MPRIRCHYVDCFFLDAGFCGASAVELDPEVGCMTFTHVADASDDDNWNEEDLEEMWEEEELLEPDEDDDDLWLEEEEET
ncbi:MAG: hypothetical protein ACE5JF_02405 [Anaerolineales bacterium]